MNKDRRKGFEQVVKQIIADQPQDEETAELVRAKTNQCLAGVHKLFLKKEL